MLLSVDATGADAEPWPLDRAPGELVVLDVSGADALRPDSGETLDDRIELALLRGARDAFAARRRTTSEYTRLAYSVPDTGEEQHYLLLLRDELPSEVLSALALARALE